MIKEVDFAALNVVFVFLCSLIAFALAILA